MTPNIRILAALPPISARGPVSPTIHQEQKDASKKEKHPESRKRERHAQHTLASFIPACAN
jgi:hypothetical protein